MIIIAIGFNIIARVLTLWQPLAHFSVNSYLAPKSSSVAKDRVYGVGRIRKFIDFQLKNLILTGTFS